MKKFVFSALFLLLLAALLLPTLSVKAETPVVFVCDGGTGDGSSPDSPLGNGEAYLKETTTSYKSHSINLAIDKIKETGGTVVLVGPTTIKYGRHAADSAKSFSDSPISSKELDPALKFTITSVYGGVDYRKTNDAALIIARSPSQALCLQMRCSATFDDITLRWTNEKGTTSNDRNTVFAAWGFPLTIGEGFVNEVWLEGKKLSETKENILYFPILAGGGRISNMERDTDLTVLAGTWHYVCGGISASPTGTYSEKNEHLTGNVNLTFGGSAKTLMGLGGGSYSRFGTVSGDIRINVTGGRIIGNLDLAGKGGFASESSKVTAVITGGDFTELDFVTDAGIESTVFPPEEGILDLSGLSEKDADRVWQSVVSCDKILFPGGREESRRTETQEVYPAGLVEMLHHTYYTRKDFSELKAEVTYGSGKKTVLDMIAMLQPADLPESDFEIPTTSEVIRDKTIEYFNAQSEMAWTPEKTMDFTGARSYTKKLIYEVGTTYFGLPYTSGRDPGACIDEFLDNVDFRGVYTGPTSYSTVVGGDCGSMRRAWAWGGAICNVGMNYSDYEMFESSASKVKGVIVPIGGYDFSHYDYNKTTADSIIAFNTPEQMYNAYACLRAADLIGNRHMSGGNVEQHVRLITEDAHVARTVDGRISPELSYIVFSEQTSTLREVEGGMTTWALGTKVAFETLRLDGYVPMTTKTLADNVVTIPEMTFDDSGKSGKDLIGYGKITGNYNIFHVDATFTDEDGKVVRSVRLYPYGLVCNLQYETKIRTIASLLTTGKTYRYQLTATIGPGTKTLVDLTYTK